jgi:hypothetical protein
MTLRMPIDDVDDRIDERCDEFESVWRSENRPSITDFIGPEDEPHRDRLFCELLLVDLECRRSLGEQPSESDYVREYPGFITQIHATRLRYGDSAFPIPRNEAETVHDISKTRKTRVAQFELIERLGVGGMGEAWKAWDTVLNRHVTIKLPHYHALAENDRQRFLREARAAGQCRHPQLPGVHEVHNSGDTVYIVATFIEGRNLQEHATGRRLPITEVVKLCAGIADALQSAHDKGVIHRDLKPANIIVGPDETPHIIDFGLARLLDAECHVTRNGELVGTPAYMAPELASGDSASADARTDVYSLGVILYELLTAQPPFSGSWHAVISQILACKPSPPRSLSKAIPRDLETICLKAIEKAPGSRYQSAREMAIDLRLFAAGKSIRARRAGVPEMLWRWIRRHPAATAGLAVGLIAAIGPGVFIVELQHRNRQLMGIRPVQVTTMPGGAQLAIVRVDPNTNEPSGDATEIIRPAKATPINYFELQAGTYLIEAVLPGRDGAFAEVYRTIQASENSPAAIVRNNLDAGLYPETSHMQDIKIAAADERIKKMVRVVVPDDARKRDPTLPEQLYVDASQTKAVDLGRDSDFAGLLSVDDDGNPYLSYAGALRWAELNQVCLPTAIEMDLIVNAAKQGKATFVDSGKSARMDDLFDAVPEWTVTIKRNPNVAGNAAQHLLDLHVLKGCSGVRDPAEQFPWAEGQLLAGENSKSLQISVRGVRSATPRFVKP